MTDTTIISATTQNVAITNLVTLNNDTPVTTSLKIAEVFGKSHKHVIRAIENAIKTINGLNFKPVNEPKIGPVEETASEQDERNFASVDFDTCKEVA